MWSVKYDILFLCAYVDFMCDNVAPSHTNLLCNIPLVQKGSRTCHFYLNYRSMHVTFDALDVYSLIQPRKPDI